jgi:hypothetical protein
MRFYIFTHFLFLFRMRFYIFTHFFRFYLHFRMIYFSTTNATARQLHHILTKKTHFSSENDLIAHTR